MPKNNKKGKRQVETADAFDDMLAEVMAADLPLPAAASSINSSSSSSSSNSTSSTTNGTASSAKSAVATATAAAISSSSAGLDATEERALEDAMMNACRRS
jgi:hypothetical protein